MATLSYFVDALAVPHGGTSDPGPNQAFRITYATDREAAVKRGWPVRTLPLGHLRQLHDPNEVAEAILGLLGQVLPGLA